MTKIVDESGIEGAIGSIVVGFEQVRFMVEGLVWELLGLTRRKGEAVTPFLLFSNLVAVVRRMMEEFSIEPDT